MRRSFRIVLPVTAAAMMVLAGGSTALAASSPAPAPLDRDSVVTVLKTSQTTVTEGGFVDGQSKKIQTGR